MDPVDAQKQRTAPRELLATVEYETNFFGYPNQEILKFIF